MSQGLPVLLTGISVEKTGEFIIAGTLFVVRAYQASLYPRYWSSVDPTDLFETQLSCFLVIETNEWFITSGFSSERHCMVTTNRGLLFIAKRDIIVQALRCNDVE